MADDIRVGGDLSPSVELTTVNEFDLASNSSSGDSNNGRREQSSAGRFAEHTHDSSQPFNIPPAACGTPTLRPNSPNQLPILLNCTSESIQYRPRKHLTVDTNMARMRVPTPDSSISGLSLETPEEEKKNKYWRNMTVMYSCIYAVLLSVLGGIIYLINWNMDTRHISETFSSIICIIGMCWLLFFHIDLFRYKQKVLRKIMGTNQQVDHISTCTEFNYAITFLGNESPPYRFLQGRHSGSFYLKAGLAAFCFGHLINEGLQLGQQTLNYAQEDRYKMGCGELSAVVLHSVKPLYSFYQLFIIFKYSNVIINRFTEVARFGVMHIMATCVCFWFGTIVEDALEDYHHKLGKDMEEQNHNLSFTSDHAICSHLINESKCACAVNAILSVNNVQAIPYLYPFTIEFNILLAGVWFIVWHNIGKVHKRANPHHFHHKIHTNDGIEEITYQSNLVINADCHAANKGLFAGLFVLMISIISIIVFFVAMSSKDHYNLGMSIHYFQEAAMALLTLGGVLLAYKQMMKLDFNLHPITFLDDVLLFMPLPFFFIQSLLTIIAEYHNKKVMRIVLSVLTPVQVILQTPFIIDALRRCSNTQSLRYKKPGREIVTFLIVCNLTAWIIETFEAKSVEFHYGQNSYFSEHIWMFVTHTTLPLTLFYRFHSSVCLADIWKSAYEKGE